MGGDSNLYLDSIIVPLSLFFTIGYHAFLWQKLKHSPAQTSIGLAILKRRAWLRLFNHGDDKKGMLVVQSLRNSLMYAILTATMTVMLAFSVAAFASTSVAASDLLSSNELFGLQSSRIVVLKYGLSSLFLVSSFLFSSMAVSYLVDANFLMNAIGCADVGSSAVVERGFTLAVVGSRLLCIAFPLLCWMLGPLPVGFSSAALLWVLYQLDFPSIINKL